MNCHDLKTRLDHPDYTADTTLEPDALVHLEGCADCARYRERLVVWRLPFFIPLAAAAGIAAIFAASLFSLPSQESENVAMLPGREVEAAPAAATYRLPAETVEIGFVQTRGVLMKRFEAQKRSAAPEQIAMLEQMLATMDSAVQDIHVALEGDPYNASLLFKLSHTRRRELRLLQQIVL